MALPPLNVKIGADTSELQRGLAGARRTLAGFAVAAVAGFAAVSAGLAAMTRQGLSAVDAQAKMARSMDGTVNGLRAVQLAGGDAGVSLGELNTAAQQLNRELSRAAEGTGAASDALDKLGLEARQLQRLDVDKRFALIADRAKELGLSSGETSDILRDLGVRSRNMALLLTQGGDAIRAAREEVTAFGLELTEVQTQAIERANDAVSRMRLIFESLAQRLAVDVAPVLESIANRFNEFAKSETAQKAIERLSTAFGDLASTILSEDFMGAAISGLETLASVASSAADLMVGLANNVEIVTAAMAGLSIAVAALGGPLTLVVGLLGGALVGISALRKAGDDGSKGLDAAQQATTRLNEALGVFHETASPAAAKQARDLARANMDIAKTALAAAKAELEKNKAIADSDFRVGNVSGGADAVDERLEQSQARVDALNDEVAALERLEQTLSSGIGRSSVAGPPGTPEPSGEGGETDDDDGGFAIPSLGGGGAVADQMDGRLDALLNGLRTEEEALNEWRAEGLELLNEALEQERITEQEHREAVERIEEEHQERMNGLQRREAQARLAGMQGMFRGLASLMRTENDKLFKIGQAAAIANATVSGFQAAVEAWNWGMARGGPPAAAAATAASLARTGALISQIASQSASGGGGGGRSGGSGGRGGAAQAEAPPTQRLRVEVVGDGVAGDAAFRTLELIQEALDNGGQIEGLIAERVTG